MSDSWDVTAEICRDIASLAGARGAETVFVVLPSRFQVYERRFREAIEGFDVEPENVVDLDVPTRRLVGELRERDLQVMSLLNEFRRAAERDEGLYGSVDPHLTPAGHRVVARHVAPLLVRVLNKE